jgi:hypothetical protein
MNADADYKAAIAYLNRPLPAYVTYHETSHAKVDAITRDNAQTLVVRTKDGKVLRGKTSSINIGSNDTYHDNVVVRPPFKPACYAATTAAPAVFDGRHVEAIGLRHTCDSGSSPHARRGDFSTLYVDPRSHLPLGAVGGIRDAPVVVNLEQRYARFGAYVLPALLDVRVKGSGLMFWLDVAVRQEYSGYAFSDKAPN